MVNAEKTVLRLNSSVVLNELRLFGIMFQIFGPKDDIVSEPLKTILTLGISK